MSAKIGTFQYRLGVAVARARIGHRKETGDRSFLNEAHRNGVESGQSVFDKGRPFGAGAARKWRTVAGLSHKDKP